MRSRIDFVILANTLLHFSSHFDPTKLCCSLNVQMAGHKSRMHLQSASRMVLCVFALYAAGPEIDIIFFFGSTPCAHLPATHPQC